MGIRRSQADAIGATRNGQTDQMDHGAVEPSAPSRPGFVAAYRKFAEETDLATLALDPGELFGGIREEAQGRDVRL